MIRNVLVVAALVVAVAGCSASPGGPGPPNASAGPTSSSGPGTSASPAAALTTTGLKLALIDRFGPLWYCDPDIYPIARDTETDRALARWPELMADRVTTEAIATHLGISLAANLTDSQKVAVYGLWKLVNATRLGPEQDGSYPFEYVAQPKEGATQGTRFSGTISEAGVITIDKEIPQGRLNCPICLARGSLIETPAGAVPVESLSVGDAVWTLDLRGDKVSATVLAHGSTTAPAGHRVVHLVLADGRSVTASPGHPLADGRSLGSIRPGDSVGGSRVVAADLSPYAGQETFDILVSGPTGTYLIDGIALGSTLRP